MSIGTPGFEDLRPTRTWRLRVALLLGLSSGTAFAAEVDGELDWANRVTLSVPVSGQVEQLNVRAGQRIEAGDALLQLDARAARAHLAQARAAVERETLQRAEAQREWDRAKELYDRTVLSERELQLAEIGFSAADADYRSARAAQVAAEVDLEHHSLKAPFSARVLATHVLPGQAVINAVQPTPLVTLAERGKMRARAAVDAVQAAAVELDAPLAVRIGEQRFEGRVQAIRADTSDAAARYLIEVEFAVPAEAPLYAGQAAVLVLP